MTEVHYDALIIGSGQAGTPLSIALAQANWKVALVEREHAGGTCVSEGCTPTKTMVASARVAHLARRAADYGVEVGGVQVDLARVRARKQGVVDSFRSANESGIEGARGLAWLQGEARFTGPKAVTVTFRDGKTQALTAEHIFINVGARPSVPPIPGLDAVPTLDSTSIMELDAPPEHLLVLGGGYVGLEFAQMFRRFGSRVTVVGRSAQLLNREDADIAAEVARILCEDGVEVLLETATRRAAPGPNGGVQLTLQTPAGERRLEGSHLLVATGRTPNTDQLGVAAGLETDEKGFLRVNERLETNVPNVYALGDVKTELGFTHVAHADFRIVKANLLDGKSASTEGRVVPYTVFIDPQLGRVGLSEKEAREQGFNVRIAKLPMAYVARAIETGETRGFMKAIVDADTERILGFAMLGTEGGEVTAVVQTAMSCDAPYTVLRDSMFSHPTLAESLNNLFSALEG